MKNPNKILVAGAAGALGLEILKILHQYQVPVRALVRSTESAQKVEPYTNDIFIADAKDAHQLTGVAEGVEIVISAMGKSVSLFTNKPYSFYEIDFNANRNVLNQALQAGVKRFIYVSIKGADTASHLQIARVHKKFEDLLRSSGLDHTIFRPVGFYSGLMDLVIIGKRKLIPLPGSGEYKTNSIHQEDLAKAIFKFLYQGPEVIEIGGPQVHTRNEIAAMIGEKTGAAVVHVPEFLTRAGLMVPRLLHKNYYYRLSYFKYVTTHDMVGDRYGSITFKEYLNSLDLTKVT